jgi:hypothetical protein
MRAVARPGPGSRRGSGRWVWGLSGLVTAAVLGVPLTHLITGVGDQQGARPQHVVTRTETTLTVSSGDGTLRIEPAPR